MGPIDKNDIVERLARLEGILSVLVADIHCLQDNGNLFEEQVTQQVEQACSDFEERLTATESSLKKIDDLAIKTQKLNKLDNLITEVGEQKSLLSTIKARQNIVFAVLGAVASSALFYLFKAIFS